MFELSSSSNEAVTGTAATLATSVYDRLREDVLSGRLRPGQKLRLETLRRDYGVGTSPLREALNRLSTNGLVTHQDQRGFRVATVSRDEMLELVRARCLLEETALRESISHGDDAWEESVVLAFHRLSRVPRSQRRDAFATNDEWEIRHREFHMAMLNGCNSRWVLQFCGQLFEQADRYRHIAVVAVFPQRDELAEHAAIKDAALKRDATEAVNLLHAHYRRTSAIINDAIPESA